jgi:nucleoside-diphosphate-sugar epimerase
LLNFARKRKVKKFIFASTEWVYGNFLNKEKKSVKSKIDTSKLDNHYSLSKYLCENIIQLNDDIMSVILRFGIIYGNKVNNFSAVEALTKLALDKKQIKICSLNTSRNFIHVEDLVKGIFKSIIVKQKNNLVLDLQGSKSTSLGKILKILKKKLKLKINFFETNRQNASIRKINYYSSHTKLNFKPEIDIEKGLDKVIKTIKNEKKN